MDDQEQQPATSQKVPNSGTPNRFSLSLLLLLTWVVVLTLAPVVRWGEPMLSVSLTLLAAGILLIHGRWKWALGALAPLVALSSIFIAAQEAHPDRHHVQCMFNLKMISLAILSYEQVHGKLPPPYSMDDQGRPLHSWRVLVLPYMDRQALFDQIDLSIPWNAPANLKFASEMPDWYRCPLADPKGERFTTPYTVVVGPETVWSGSQQRSLSESAVMSDNTLLVMESATYERHWMDPYAPQFDELIPIEAEGRTLIAQHYHRPKHGGPPAAFTDGHCGFLPGYLHWQQLRDLWRVGNKEHP